MELVKALLISTAIYYGLFILPNALIILWSREDKIMEKKKICNECTCKPVCSKLRATGGVSKCEYYVKKEKEK